MVVVFPDGRGRKAVVIMDFDLIRLQDENRQERQERDSKETDRLVADLHSDLSLWETL